MWIDAICINQEDIPERNIQTQNMRAIYQNAERVAVYLGIEYNGSAEAMQLARDINSCTSSEQVEELLEYQKEDVVALVRLMRRRYFWRIWVVQEVTCGKRITIYCGDDEMSWNRLDNVCDILKEHQPFLHQLFYKNQGYVRTLVAGGPKGLQISRYSPGNLAPPLLELLCSHKGKKSTDPKDKVFALIGISASRYSFGKIDYSQSLREIYSHTARHIISTTQRLDVTCLKQYDVLAHNLPSWAPNWMRAPSSAGTTLVGLHHHDPPFRGAGDTLASAEFLCDGYVLKATGVILDTVKSVGMPYIKKGAPGDPVPPLRGFHNWWNLFVASRSESISDQAVFARTISCGNWQFDTEDEYSMKIDSIFTLLVDTLTEDDIENYVPPSRVSSFPISRSTSMSTSVTSLPGDENDEEYLEVEDKERLGTIISASLSMNRRRLVISENGYVGLGMWNVEVGDLICILLGCNFPVILRRIENHYVLIGEAYIDGIMNGEAMEGLKNGEHETQSFEIH